MLVVSLCGVNYRFSDEYPPGNKVSTHFFKLWSSLSFPVGLCPGWSVTNSQARTSSSSGKNTRGYQYVFGKSLLCNSMAVSGSSASISVLFLEGFNSLKRVQFQRSSSTRPFKCRKPIDHNTHRLNFETWRKHAK